VGKESGVPITARRDGRKGSVSGRVGTACRRARHAPALACLRVTENCSLFSARCDYNVVVVADILGSFEQAVLLAIVRLDDGAYGRAILKEVAVRLERDVAAGAVQATLERLERKGLVRSRLGSGTPIRDGRARRFYTVLSEGLRALNDARKAHESVWRGFGRPLKARG